MAFESDSIFWVEVEKIVPNPFQPRRDFDQERLQELAESIRMYGVLQPLTVTRREIQRADGAFYTEYELIAGERRLRASKLAGIGVVPVIIREGDQDEQEKLELAIIENLQREDLNAIDRALAFKQLADTFNLSHTQVAKKVGRSREYVSNSVRLLLLPEYMLQAVRSGELSEGHARTLLMLSEKPEEQDTVFREILLKKLSVREVERIARSIATDKVRKKDKNFDPELIELEREFTETLGTRVQIQKTEFGGKLTIDYFSPEDLAYMLERMRIDQIATTNSGRRPFSPPSQISDGQEASNDHQQIDQLTDSTPLSALIAQLQQVEAKYTPEAVVTKESKLPDQKEDATILDNEQVVHLTAAEEDVVSLSEAEETISEKILEQQIPAQVRVVQTDAPVSMVVPQMNTSQSNVPYTPVASHGPRIVCVNRACTTAVYVATADPASIAEETSGLDSADTKTTPKEDVDQQLYSIRNFYI